MAKKSIVSIGARLASDDIENVEFSSKSSLLDWDIVIFRPDITGLKSSVSSYQGKPSLSDNDSFLLKECCAHWRNQISEAFQTGKTIIVYLCAPAVVYVATGEVKYSGTGRNQKGTRIVTEFHNYQSLPLQLTPMETIGKAMVLHQKYAQTFHSYWIEFERESKYFAILSDEKIMPCILTKSGAKAVGAIFKDKKSGGSIALLPDMEFDNDDFSDWSDDGEEIWTIAGEQFGQRFAAKIIELDKALRATSDVTPEPTWATKPEYELEPESDLRSKLLLAEAKIESGQKEKEHLSAQISTVGAHRGLLFEKGKPLEENVLNALRLLGFTASNFKDATSEFDVVFESSEGRLIGEVEGKDNKAVNIDKLRQLGMNVQEDLSQVNVKIPAKSVLFGNGFRLQDLNERPDPFTEKCRSSALTTNTALVFTPDLFPIVQYLLKNPDESFAQSCRYKLFSAVGRVNFPPVPASATSKILINDEASVSI
jgi:hypothetical protein